MEPSYRQCDDKTRALDKTVSNGVHSDVNQNTCFSSQPTVKQMRNGKGLVRNKDLTATLYHKSSLLLRIFTT